MDQFWRSRKAAIKKSGKSGNPDALIFVNNLTLVDVLNFGFFDLKSLKRTLLEQFFGFFEKP